MGRLVKDELVRISGQRLRLLREATGMSQRALAKQVGVSAMFISLVERGQSGVSVRRLRLIATALDAPARIILGEFGVD